jgi:excisionase family DNA binding protein
MARDRPPQPAVDLSKFISVAKAAKLADVTDRYMRTLVKSGRVEGVKIGRDYVVSEASARAFVRTASEGRPRAKASKPRKRTPRRT